MAKLEIKKCSVSTSGNITVTKEVYQATINPEDYSQSHSIHYTTKDAAKRPIGKSMLTAEFGYVESESVKFKLVIDATGVVQATENKTVEGELDRLKEIVYKYDGDKHETNVVLLNWGKRGVKPFYGRLTSMSVAYTLFRPSGEALRAKIDLSFTSYATRKEEAVTSGRNSPDMTHKVTVRAGDTLPLLCDRIYDDQLQYTRVAQHNRLSGLRMLKPGQILEFPPIR